MFAALDLATRVSVGVGLILATAWLATWSLQVILRRRGSIWQLSPERRSGRIVEAYLLALAITAVATMFDGWLARLLKLPFWYGAIPAAVVSLWATFKVAKRSRTCGRWARCW
ncbi:hypothetical protein [Roseomonas sp. USHLN139]|uniref:hypothetical protein n=1 Tax=Roseomonas sp. USHLN139 TaxID=3081298 RepID=UPI003B01A01A